ncbi:MAG: FhaA domain-containing protein [bacterium]
MSAIQTIDQGIRRIVFSLFWWFIDPLEKDRLFGEIADKLERNLDATNPEHVVAPDNFEVLVNNTVFIRHAHSIATLESVLKQRLQKYVADQDYELNQPRIKLQILSSATISKRKSDISCWFSEKENEAEPATSGKGFLLEVVDGDGQGSCWNLEPGKTYKIGRHSSSNICLPFDNISKHHATLYFVAEDTITIVDEGSANGTFIDDEPDRINGSRRLKIGDKIRFCQRDPIILTFSEK